MLFPHSHFMSQSYYHGCECGRTSHTFVWVVCENISCNKCICPSHNFVWLNSSVYLLLTLGYPQPAKAVLPCILDMDLEGMQVHIAQFFVVQFKCVPVADVGVSPVCPSRPPLHPGYGPGGNAGEVSNIRVLSLHCVCGCI